MEKKELIKSILNDCNIKVTSIEKAPSGWTNDVYIINKSYILKVCKEIRKIEKLRKEQVILKSLEDFGYTAKPVGYGKKNEYGYLIYEYIQGTPLYYIWHELTEEKRRNLIFQLCQFLKAIHGLDYKKIALNSGMLLIPWKDRGEMHLDMLIKRCEKAGFDMSEIKKVTPKISDIFKEEHLALCHNACHFDNLLLTPEGRLRVIDFGSSGIYSTDYELRTILFMCKNPWNYANEETQKFIKKEDYKNILKYMKEFYPKLFKMKNIDMRVETYFFLYRLYDLSKPHIKNPLPPEYFIESYLKKLNNHYALS